MMMSADVGHRLGRRLLAQVATLATPDLILRWHRELVARKWTYRAGQGPPCGRAGTPPSPRHSDGDREPHTSASVLPSIGRALNATSGYCEPHTCHGLTAIICSSTRAPSFSAATCTVALAGGSVGKNSRYTALNLAKSSKLAM